MALEQHETEQKNTTKCLRTLIVKIYSRWWAKRTQHKQVHWYSNLKPYDKGPQLVRTWCLSIHVLKGSDLSWQVKRDCIIQNSCTAQKICITNELKHHKHNKWNVKKMMKKSQWRSSTKLTFKSNWKSSWASIPSSLFTDIRALSMSNFKLNTTRDLPRKRASTWAHLLQPFPVSHRPLETCSWTCQ